MKQLYHDPEYSVESVNQLMMSNRPGPIFEYIDINAEGICTKVLDSVIANEKLNSRCVLWVKSLKITSQG